MLSTLPSLPEVIQIDIEAPEGVSTASMNSFLGSSHMTSVLDGLLQQVYEDLHDDTQGDILHRLFAASQASRCSPTPDDVIAHLLKTNLTQPELDACSSCVVCQEDFQLAQEGTHLPCKHIYHFACIEPWLKVNDSCPCCRKKVQGGEGREEEV